LRSNWCCTLGVALAALFSCALESVAQGLTLPARSTLILGQGYDVPLGAAKPTPCIAPGSPARLVAPVDSLANVTAIKNSSDLSDRTGITVTAVYSGGTYSGSAGYSALISRSVHDYSESVHARVAVRRGSERITPKPLPKFADLYEQDYLQFLLTCGTHFVVQSTFGGSFEFVFSASSHDATIQEQIRLSANAAVHSASKLEVQQFQELFSATTSCFGGMHERSGRAWQVFRLATKLACS